MSENDTTPRTVTVYELYSTRDEEPRYIGQTVGKLNHRLAAHICCAKHRKSRLTTWILKELAAGYLIKIRAIECNAIFHFSEMMWIRGCRDAGERLLNMTDGGEGTLGWHGLLGIKRPYLAERNRQSKGKPGHPSTPETNAKISAAHKGKKKPWTAARNKSQAGLPGHKHTEESKRKISAAHTGRTISAEWRAKISASRSGQKPSDATLEKMRARRHSDSTKKLISLSNIGRKWTPQMYAKAAERVCSAQTRTKLSEALTGRTFSSEHKNHLSEARRRLDVGVKKLKPLPKSDRRNGPMSDETKKKISVAHKNKPKSPEQMEKLNVGYRRYLDRRNEIRALALVEKQGRPDSEVS